MLMHEVLKTLGGRLIAQAVVEGRKICHYLFRDGLVVEIVE